MLRKSRLTQYERSKAITRIVVAFLLIFLLVFAAIAYFPQLILGIVALNAKITPQTDRHQLKEDRLAPFPPHLDALPEATSAEQINLTGSAEVHSVVQLYIGGVEVDRMKADSDGNFMFTNIPLAKGDNLIYARATDSSGNTSGKSETKTVSVKTEGPALEVASEVNPGSGKVSISGVTDTEAELTINGRRVVVLGSGRFRAAFKLASGANKFHIEARDAAGNKTEKELTVNYALDEE